MASNVASRPDGSGLIARRWPRPCPCRRRGAGSWWRRRASGGFGGPGDPAVASPRAPHPSRAGGRGPRPHHPLRHQHRGRPPVVHRAARRGVRPARTQRRGQDLDGRDARGLPPADRRAGPGARARPDHRPRAAHAPGRRDAAVGRRLHRCPTARGPAAVRRLLRRPRRPGRADRPGRPGRPSPGHLAQPVGGRAAAALPGPRPGRPTRGGLPRRAHRRDRPQRAPARSAG